MTRRTLGWYAEHPRAFDQAVYDWNDREIARYELGIDRADAEADRYEAWLESMQVDPDFEAWLWNDEPEDGR